MFGLGGKKTRKRVLELRRPVTVPREICSLGRMNDDKDGDDRKQSRLASSPPSPHPPAEELAVLVSSSKAAPSGEPSATATKGFAINLLH
jgi:hypothetical protein